MNHYLYLSKSEIGNESIIDFSIWHCNFVSGQFLIMEKYNYTYQITGKRQNSTNLVGCNCYEDESFLFGNITNPRKLEFDESFQHLAIETFSNITFIYKKGAHYEFKLFCHFK